MKKNTIVFVAKPTPPTILKISEQSLQKIVGLIDNPKYLVMLDRLSEKGYYKGPGVVEYTSEITSLSCNEHGYWLAKQKNGFSLPIGEYHTLENFKIYQRVSIDEI